jgi:DNA gyrase subunit A
VAARTINEEDQIMLMTRAGIVLRTDLQSIRETGRSTQGVILMDLADSDEVVGIALLKDEGDEIDGIALDGSTPQQENGDEPEMPAVIE